MKKILIVVLVCLLVAPVFAAISINESASIYNEPTLNVTGTKATAVPTTVLTTVVTTAIPTEIPTPSDTVIINGETYVRSKPTTESTPTPEVTIIPTIVPTVLPTSISEVQPVQITSYGLKIKNPLKDTAPKLKGNKIVLANPIAVKIESADNKNQTVRIMQSGNEITLPDIPATGKVAIKFQVGTITYVIRRNE